MRARPLLPLIYREQFSLHERLVITSCAQSLARLVAAPA
jgi:hypothetical protein